VTADLGWDGFMRVDVASGASSRWDFPRRAGRRGSCASTSASRSVRRSSAQITNYERDQLVDRRVIAVVTPPNQIGPVRSECLVLGTSP
jgi:hypothetical protein